MKPLLPKIIQLGRNHLDNNYNLEVDVAKKITKLPALLVAYQRPDSIKKISEDFLTWSTGSLYISVDFPKNEDSISVANFHEIVHHCNELKNRYPDRIVTHFRNKNAGCAASILSSVDWFFKNEEYGAILEDDCIPTMDFYRFSEDAIEYMKAHSDVLLSCGTQFVPPEITQSSGFKSKYILTWGWASTSKHWATTKSILIDADVKPRFKNLSLASEVQYWRAGARRAYQGYVDVWDTALVNALQRNNYLSILPGQNLVTNVGSDAIATHTGDSNWIEMPTFPLKGRQLQFVQSHDSDKWLREKLFKIRWRHLITTRMTWLKDTLYGKPKFSLGLIPRWLENTIPD